MKVDGFLIAAFALAASGTGSAAASPGEIRGMFLCPSPVIANDLWRDVVDVGSKGLRVTFPMLEKLAARNRCEFAASSSLKPIKFVAAQFRLRDGAADGWAHPDYYIRYVND
jgi:hypothetical protein